MAPLTGQAIVNAAQNRPLILNEGQMFHGQIKQLFPGQMAEVQIGGQKMVAKLEVPMKVGESYYFQVNAIKPELQLKIISGPLQATEGQARQLNGLMDAMQLPKTPEMQALLSFVMRNKIPMTRENLLEAESLLKSVPAAMRNEALMSIQRLAELKLPFTENLFRSLLGVETKEGLHNVLASLKSALLADTSLSPQVRNMILSVLENMAKPFAQATGSTLLSHSLLALLDSAETPASRFTILQMLKEAGVLPDRTSLANLQQVLTSLLTNDSVGRPENLASSQQTTQTGQSMQQILNNLRQISTNPQPLANVPLEGLKASIMAETGMNSQQKAELIAIIDRAIGSPQNTETTAGLVRDIGQAIIRMNAQNVLATPFQTTEGPKEQMLSMLGHQGAGNLTTFQKLAEHSDNPVIQKMMQSTEAAVAAAVDGRAMKEALQTVIRSLGFNYEAGLLSKESDFGRLAEALKPQLLALIQDPSISSALRVAAETVVMRMNGPLLQSGENGVQHQLVMQVPLEFFGKRIDATLQWNGRMKEDGKIDPDFARILFYLELESIEKTIIDMQVQNRVVSVTVFNADDTLKIVGGQLQQKLKEGLDSAGYKLSGVFYKQFEEEKKEVLKKKKGLKTDGQGVDFLI